MDITLLIEIAYYGVGIIGGIFGIIWTVLQIRAYTILKNKKTNNSGHLEH